jgi:hypothetical protein
MTLRIDKDESHWTITLSRPDKLNALSAELIDALDDAFEEVAAAGVPLVALRGEGRCLSAGFDMTGVEQQSEGDLLLRFVRIELLLQRIVALPCLTVAFAQAAISVRVSISLQPARCGSPRPMRRSGCLGSSSVWCSAHAVLQRSSAKRTRDGC